MLHDTYQVILKKGKQGEFNIYLKRIFVQGVCGFYAHKMKGGNIPGKGVACK